MAKMLFISQFLTTQNYFDIWTIFSVSDNEFYVESIKAVALDNNKVFVEVKWWGCGSI